MTPQYDTFTFPTHPNMLCARTITKIKHIPTGEIRQLDSRWTDYIVLVDGKPSTYIWSEGNYSCDCNRHLSFNPAPCEPHECGHSEYSVEIRNAVDNTIIYTEWEPTQ